MDAVVYAETFGNPSETWMWRQVGAAGTPVLTHAYVQPEVFPHEPVWIVPRRRTVGDRLRALLRGHGFRLPAATERAVTEKLRHEGAPLLHAHYGPAGLRLLPVAQALGVPLLVTFHGFDISRLPGVDPRYRRALPELFAYADCIAVSEEVRGRLAELGAPRIHHLPLGMPVGEPAPPRPAREEIHLLTIARLVPRKGVPALVRAVRASDRPLVLHVVGDGPDRPAVEAAAADDPRIVLHGVRTPEQVRAHLEQSDLFVLNSRFSDEGESEAFGIVLLEAMERGLPVVGTRHGGIPEAVVHEETGLLVPERDDEALRQAIESLADDAEGRLRLGAAGRRRVEQEFELDACTRRLLDLYAERRR